MAMADSDRTVPDGISLPAKPLYHAETSISRSGNSRSFDIHFSGDFNDASGAGEWIDWLSQRHGSALKNASLSSLDYSLPRYRAIVVLTVRELPATNEGVGELFGVSKAHPV